MNARKFTQTPEFTGGCAEDTRTANDGVKPRRRVDENAFFFHPQIISEPQFESGVRPDVKARQTAAGAKLTSTEAFLRFPERRARR